MSVSKECWERVLSWTPDDKPLSTEAVVEASNKGRFRRLPYAHWSKKNQGYSNRKVHYYPVTENRGKKNKVDAMYGRYLSVRIRNKTYMAHRLVALAFIPNPENKAQVNHINGIKNDNRAENLEWVTNKENARHASLVGLRDGVYKEQEKLTDDQVSELCSRRLSGETTRELANEYNVSHETIRFQTNKRFSNEQIKQIQTQAYKTMWRKRKNESLIHSQK